MTHPNETLLHNLSAAWSRKDSAVFLDCFTDDIIFHIPGRSPLAGTYHGIREFLRIAFVHEQVGGSRSWEPLAVFAEDETGVMVLRTHWQFSDAETYDLRIVWVTRFREGKIAEVWICFGDQYAVDEIAERMMKVMPTGFRQRVGEID